MLESALSLLHSTCLAGSSSSDQHWQSGSLASVSLALCFLNLHWQYLPLNTGSLSRAQRPLAAAAVEPAKQVQLELALEVQVKAYWHVDPNYFEFQRESTSYEVEGLNLKKQRL